jgi:hypothetical protein
MRSSVLRPISLPAAFCLLLSAAGELLPSGPIAAQDHTYAEHAGHGDPAVAEGRLQVVHEPEHKDLVVLLGPVSIAAGGHTMKLTPAAAVEIPIDGWLTGFQARVVDPDGRELPSEILHHINVVRPGHRELFFPTMQRLAAAGQETGEIKVPFPFGVPLTAGDTLLVVAMLHNPTGQAVEVTVVGRLHYDTPAWLNRVGVQPFYMDVKQRPADAAFDLPPGRSTFAWEGSPAIDVEILGLGGHLHAHAVEIRLEEVRSEGGPRVLWQSRPSFREDGLVREIPRKTFLMRLGLGLSKDRTYRVVVVYENTTGQVITGGGMAELAGVVLPGAPWPEPDRSDPRYRADYRHFTRNNPALRDRVAEAETVSAGHH